MSVEERDFLMTVELMKIDISDDPKFIEAVGALINNAAGRVGAAEVYVTKIKNWFDHKWLRFSGKGVVYSPTTRPRQQVEAALDEFSQDQLTFPPFNPNRVLDQRRWVEREPAGYVEAIPTKRVHPKRREWSCANLHRRVADFSDSAVFVWYSSNSYTNGVGSVMVYIIEDGAATGWYGMLQRHEDGWRLDRVKGIDREEVVSYIGSLAAPPTAVSGNEATPL
jgi:hypothetical protein